MLEAFASGVPVITSKGTALEEVAGAAAILVDPYSVEEISNELKNMLDLDESAVSRLRVKGIERALMFSWRNVAADTYEVYKKLV